MKFIALLTICLTSLFSMERDESINQESVILNLPVEVQYNIFEKLIADNDPTSIQSDLIRTSMVCKAWKALYDEHFFPKFIDPKTIRFSIDNITDQLQHFVPEEICIQKGPVIMAKLEEKFISEGTAEKELNEKINNHLKTTLPYKHFTRKIFTDYDTRSKTTIFFQLFDINVLSPQSIDLIKNKSIKQLAIVFSPSDSTSTKQPKPNLILHLSFKDLPLESLMLKGFDYKELEGAFSIINKMKSLEHLAIESSNIADVPTLLEPLFPKNGGKLKILYLNFQCSPDKGEKFPQILFSELKTDLEHYCGGGSGHGNSTLTLWFKESLETLEREN